MARVVNFSARPTYRTSCLAGTAAPDASLQPDPDAYFYPTLTEAPPLSGGTLGMGSIVTKRKGNTD